MTTALLLGSHTELPTMGALNQIPELDWAQQKPPSKLHMLHTRWGHTQNEYLQMRWNSEEGMRTTHWYSVSGIPRCSASISINLSSKLEILSSSIHIKTSTNRNEHLGSWVWKGLKKVCVTHTVVKGIIANIPKFPCTDNPQTISRERTPKLK